MCPQTPRTTVPIKNQQRINPPQPMFPNVVPAPPFQPVVHLCCYSTQSIVAHKMRTLKLSGTGYAGVSSVTASTHLSTHPCTNQEVPTTRRRRRWCIGTFERCALPVSAHSDTMGASQYPDRVFTTDPRFAFCSVRGRCTTHGQSRDYRDDALSSNIF
jgi:hypothetical protein